MRFLVINGPNLNLLGVREPDIYGSTSLADIESRLTKKADEEGASIEFFQSNFEGALVERVQKAKDCFDGILVNAGAYTHTSIALRDALLASKLPYIEIHLSNTYSRESFRHNSFLVDKAIGLVSGFGVMSYLLGLEGLIFYLKQKR